MSDKLLDCVGNAGGIGKHDFQLSDEAKDELAKRRREQQRLTDNLFNGLRGKINRIEGDKA